MALMFTHSKKVQPLIRLSLTRTVSSEPPLLVQVEDAEEVNAIVEDPDVVLASVED